MAAGNNDGHAGGLRRRHTGWRILYRNNFV
jgi:hypothetical protein